jgi:hypothetical protein
MHWLELRPQTRLSGLRLKLTNAMRVVTQVALIGMRGVTQDFGRKSKLKFFGRNPICSYVKPVVTRGSTVYCSDGSSRPIITGITSDFTFHMRWISLL